MQEFMGVDFGYSGLDEAFPPVDPGVQPFGSRVLVQIRSPKTKTRGGIIITQEMREVEHHNTQVAKIIAVGPLAFKNRQTMEHWPEGSWVEPGDFVRVPKYGGDRWTVKHKDGADILESNVIFVLFDDLNLIGKITGDPLVVKAAL